MVPVAVFRTMGELLKVESEVTQCHAEVKRKTRKVGSRG